MSYASLHVHSDYSNIRIIDSINTIEKIINRAFELGLNAVAITDHDTVSGHIKALNYYNQKKKENPDSKTKLILGNEIYLTRSGLNSETHQKGEKFYHFLLLAKDNEGHRQLRELSTRAWRRGYYKNLMRTPTFIEDLIEVVGENPGHLVATTACLSGFTGTMFMMNEYAEIGRFLDQMSSIFGEGNFYIELQPSKGADQIAYNKHMIINFWGEFPFIFTTDAHYTYKEDREIHKLFLQSKSGADRDVDIYYSDAYIMDYNEINALFGTYISQPKIEAMRLNTIKIAEMVGKYDLSHEQIVPKIKYDKVFDKKIQNEVRELFKANGSSNYSFLNSFLAAPETSPDGYLMHLIIEGYYNKLMGSSVPVEERLKRLDYELEQIHEISLRIEQPLSEYFITIGKIIEIIWNEADSLVGVGRGSAVGFLINYLVGITQIDPMTQMLYLPPWRFMHKSRPGLPDIDLDSEANKRLKIFNKIHEYFASIGSDVINVATFGTEGSKSAIRTAGRSLDLDDSLVSYLTSMIPNERGFDLTLSQCYYGDDTHAPIREFVSEMDKNPTLWKLASGIEGLITRLGAHAAGILIFKGKVSDHNSIMKTNKGIVVSAYNLEDSEQMGGLKYDLLTVAALDKIHATLNYLLEDRVIEWQGDLLSTYNKYLLPAVLEYDDPKMWEKLWEGEVIDAFQFDTMVGSQAIKLIKPESVGELAVANSIMRLMAQDNMDLPLDTFVRYKKDLNLWYHEMKLYGLTQAEIQVLEPYLKPLYGVADSQEVAMQLTMDPKITGFNLTQANSLRKAIAKKDFEVLTKTKEMFYEHGRALGTSQFMLDYVWNVQIGRQVGYSFSLLHTMAYSTITLQQMNLVHFYPSIYWKTACLSVNAGAINEEDYYNLVEEGIIELSDEEDVRSNNKIQYGKVASAIGDMRGHITVKQPDINLSRMGFTPNAAENSILYGLKGIARLGDAIIQNIILNRPYKSLADFVKKMISPDGKKLISKDRVVNLIKAGAFDDIEGRPRKEILSDYIQMVADNKKRLTLQNFLMLMRQNLVPSSLAEEQACYNFTRYIRKSRFENYYIIDEIAEDYLLERFPENRIQEIEVEGVKVKVIPQSWWDQIYNIFMDNVRAWIKANHDTLLNQLNSTLFEEEFAKYAKGDILDWELQSLNFFYSGHPLTGVQVPPQIQISNYNDIKEGEIVGHFVIKNKYIPKMRLHTIFGTVIDKDRTKGIVTLATIDAVVDVKFFKQQFAKYVQEGGDDEDSYATNFFDKGTHLLITGIKRGDMFLPKVYKNSGIAEVIKVTVKDKKIVETETKN